MASFHLWWTSEFGSRLKAALSSEGENVITNEKFKKGKEKRRKRKKPNMDLGPWQKEFTASGLSFCRIIRLYIFFSLRALKQWEPENIELSLTKIVKQHDTLWHNKTKQWELRARRTTWQIFVRSPVSVDETL